MAADAMQARTVLVGCKHPNGVILNLDVSKLTDDKGNSRRIPGRTFTLKGWAHAVNKPDPTEGMGGYALTPVPLDFWEAWIATHADFPMLEDKTILPPHKDAVSQARDHAEVPKMFAPSSGELKELTAAQLVKTD